MVDKGFVTSCSNGYKTGQKKAFTFSHMYESF